MIRGRPVRGGGEGGDGGGGEEGWGNGGTRGEKWGWEGYEGFGRDKERRYTEEECFPCHSTILCLCCCCSHPDRQTAIVAMSGAET